MHRGVQVVAEETIPSNSANCQLPTFSPCSKTGLNDTKVEESGGRN